MQAMLTAISVNVGLCVNRYAKGESVANDI